MENRYDNKDFEQFVKQNADQYRMFPSEKVWEGINNTLHTRRRWYGIGLSLLLLSVAVVSWVMLLNPSSSKQPLTSNTTITAAEKTAAGTKQIVQEPAILITPSKTAGTRVSATATTAIILHDNLFLADANMPATDAVSEELPVVNFKDESKPLSDVVVNHPDLIASENTIKSTRQIVPNKPAFSNNLYAIIKTMQADNNTVVYTDLNKVLEEQASEEKRESVVAAKEKSIYPLTIESVVNSYQRISQRKKLSWQIYFLPTVSYRKLTENRTNLVSSQAIMGSSPLNYVVAHNVNNAVTHKPDIGLELGFNVAYPVARNVKVTGGLQLNVSKYDIKAYPYPAEQARIVLNNTNGSTSISTIETNYRNYESYTKADWLSNFYLSASLPVGLEMNLTDTRKNTYLGIGGTVQPTYILGDRAYLISTDFKNYAEVPSLTRGWNVSTSFEVFAGYTTGKINWKVGPQVRYQMLSSFDKIYPVKEHIIDFGLKVGVILR